MTLTDANQKLAHVFAEVRQVIAAFLEDNDRSLRLTDEATTPRVGRAREVEISEWIQAVGIHSKGHDQHRWSKPRDCVQRVFQKPHVLAIRYASWERDVARCAQ